MKNLEVLQIGYESCPPDKLTVHQWSAFNMLHFVLSGKGYLNGQEVHAGQMFLCRHHVFIDYKPDPQDPWSYYWINSTGSLSNELLAECGFGERDVVDFTMTDEVEHLLKISLYNTNNNYMCGIFIAIMGLICQGGLNMQKGSPGLHIESAENIIRSTNGRITPSELAEQLNLSRGYLRNIFVRFKGKSLMDYITEQRMIFATEMLAQTNQPLSVIAGTVGYSDQFQFSKRFHKFYGLTPSVYRKNMRGYKEEFVELDQRLMQIEKHTPKDKED